MKRYLSVVLSFLILFPLLGSPVSAQTGGSLQTILVDETYRSITEQGTANQTTAFRSLSQWRFFYPGAQAEPVQNGRVSVGNGAIQLSKTTRLAANYTSTVTAVRNLLTFGQSDGYEGRYTAEIEVSFDGQSDGVDIKLENDDGDVIVDAMINQSQGVIECNDGGADGRRQGVDAGVDGFQKGTFNFNQPVVLRFDLDTQAGSFTLSSPQFKGGLPLTIRDSSTAIRPFVTRGEGKQNIAALRISTRNNAMPDTTCSISHVTLIEKENSNPLKPSAELEALRAAADQLQMADLTTEVDAIESNTTGAATENLQLPKAIDDVQISWSSSNPLALDEEGTITGSGETVLTATLKKGESTAVKHFFIKTGDAVPVAKVVEDETYQTDAAAVNVPADSPSAVLDAGNYPSWRLNQSPYGKAGTLSVDNPYLRLKKTSAAETATDRWKSAFTAEKELGNLQGKYEIAVTFKTAGVKTDGFYMNVVSRDGTSVLETMINLSQGMLEVTDDDAASRQGVNSGTGFAAKYLSTNNFQSEIIVSFLIDTQAKTFEYSAPSKNGGAAFAGTHGNTQRLFYNQNASNVSAVPETVTLAKINFGPRNNIAANAELDIKNIRVTQYRNDLGGGEPKPEADMDMVTLARAASRLRLEAYAQNPVIVSGETAGRVTASMSALPGKVIIDGVETKVQWNSKTPAFIADDGSLAGEYGPAVLQAEVSLPNGKSVMKSFRLDVTKEELTTELESMNIGGGSISGTMRIRNATSGRKDGTVILALYEDGRSIKNENVAGLRLEKNTIAELPVAFSGVTDNGSYGVKAMLWDSFDTAKPIAAAAEAKLYEASVPFDSVSRLSNQTDIRFAVMSDNHVKPTKPTEIQRVKDAFRTFYQMDPNIAAVVTAGDVTDDGTQAEYQAFGSAYKAAIKPGTVFLPVRGNHDSKAAADRTGAFFQEVTGRDPFYYTQTVNGFHFICMSPAFDSTTYSGNKNYGHAREKLAADLERFSQEDPNKPIFVVTHHPMQNTVYGSKSGYADGGISDVMKQYPQVVNFSGHSHYTLNDPRSIDQTDFTSMVCSTTSYTEMENAIFDAEDNKTAKLVPYRDVSQAMIVEVTDGTKVRVRRVDLLAGKYLGEDFVFDTAQGTEGFSYTKQSRAALATIPYFPDGAAAAASAISADGCTVTFDQAENEREHVYSYEIKCVNKETGQVDFRYVVWSQNYKVPALKKLSQKITGLSPGTQYELQITAEEPWGNITPEPLTTEFTTAAQ